MPLIDVKGLTKGPFRRVLLVSPTGPSGLSFALDPVPLGLECIAACIRNDVDDIMIYDEFLDKVPFLQVLNEFKPDLVCISMAATEHNTGKTLARVIKRHNPTIPVIAGGFHPSGAPDVVLGTMEVDAVVRGEGEITFTELVAGKPWDTIDGLTYKSLGGIMRNPDRKRIENLDELPFPAREMRDRRGYVYKNRLLPGREYDLMYFGRGCWGKCTFCCEPYFSEGTQRYRSPERVFDEIMTIHACHGGKPIRILISDPNILGQHKPVERLAELLIEAGNGPGKEFDITFQVMSRTEHVVKHPDVVEKMIRAGMISWEVGLESSNEADLVITKKHVSVEKQEEGVRILRKLGGEVLGTYVIGLESQSRSFIKTFPNRARAIGCSSGAFGIATPFPGTAFWNEMAAKGRIFETNWARFDENNSVLTHPEMSPKEIEDLRSWCMGRFWNLDVVVDQYRIELARVGAFRRTRKATLFEFFTSVGVKLGFAAAAGGELASKHGGKTESEKEHFMKSLHAIFSAFINPRVETYFRAKPMQEVVDMREFGRWFSGKTIQVVLEDPRRKRCEFVIIVPVTRDGIDRFVISRKPAPRSDFLLRADIDSLYVPSGLSKMQLARNMLGLIPSGKIKVSGWSLLVKLALWCMKEALVHRLRG